MPGKPGILPKRTARQRRAGFEKVLRFWNFVVFRMPEKCFSLEHPRFFTATKSVAEDNSTEEKSNAI